VPAPEEITRHTDGDPDDVVWVDGRPPAAPIAVVDPDPSWPAQFAEIARRVRGALGDRVLELDHVGSTSVAGLPAKPIIDVDLTVADSADESAYVPVLESAGFRLLFREPSWHGHRFLVSATPAANLHVWSPDSPEVIRHRLFRDWLREHADDRARYAEVKVAAAAATNAAGKDVAFYNQQKQAVIRELLDRTFRAHHML